MIEHKTMRILCVCDENTTRSVLLEHHLESLGFNHVSSVGIAPASFSNPLVEEILAAENINIAAEDPESVEDVDLDAFDLIISLSKKAYEYLKLLKAQGGLGDAELEYWDIASPPPFGEIPRAQLLEGYMRIYEDIKAHTKNRFDV